jgi:hypothetical protein
MEEASRLKVGSALAFTVFVAAAFRSGHSWVAIDMPLESSKSALASRNDPSRRYGLPDMPLRVIGDVHQQPA